MSKILRPKYRLPSEQEWARLQAALNSPNPKDYWAALAALDYDISKTDLADPAWAKPDEDDDENIYEKSQHGE